MFLFFLRVNISDVPSLKEPVLSRAVSADCFAWECFCVCCVCRRSPQSVRTDSWDIISVLPVRSAVVFAIDVRQLVTVLRLRSRGLFGRSFQHATVPPPVPSWTPADHRLRPRSGAKRPTLIKSIRSSCGTPSRSIIVFTPGRDGQVNGTSRAGREPQGFARREAANQHRHKSRLVFSFMGLCYT